MNRKTYRLVNSRLRGRLVAVEETAAAAGKEAGQATVHSRKSQGVISLTRVMLFTPRQITLAALALLGALPSWSGAQIVSGGAHAPSVIQTRNGLDQVNINRPSGAGVSMNTYGQFDVQQKGAILNNSPVIVQTQQAGMINGNPNFGPGQSARVIVNQVNSRTASQLNGHLEVAGQRAEVVIANGSGISVNGGGFINTSRAILTTGTPNFAPDGPLSGFNVTNGNISIQGAGLNAGDVDQVDLLSRAVQANAAIYAKNLSIVTGANSISHDTLNATPIAGDGPTPYVSIDVSELGGMYANRIILVGTEDGVGVSTKGVLAAQSGDLILTTQGKLILAGQTNASGDINLSARDGIDNSGTTYARQNVAANTSGALTNSGVLAAQQNTTVNAGSVASTGTLAAGVNGDGTIAGSGDLSVAASGAVTATGRNEGGGNTTIQGASVSLTGSNTSANGTLALAAHGGELNLSGATTTAGGALNANAAGTLVNDGGKLSSGGAMQISAANVSNAGGQIVSDATLGLNTAGALVNRQGVIQSAALAGIGAATLDNTAGRIVSLNGDGMTLATTGALVNGAGGTIGTNGALNLGADTLANQGRISASTDAVVRAQVIDNHAGSIVAGNALDVTSTGILSNAGGTLSGSATSVSAASLDNTGGEIDGDALAVSTTADLVNRGGKLTQYGTGDQTVSAGGTLDNTGGTIASNATNLALTGAQISNDNGAITQAGTGALSVTATGHLSNLGGQIASNGALATHAIGNDVTVNATDVQNTGAAAVIAGANSVRLYAQNSVTNADGALIYSAGNLEIAKDGTRDASGLLANQSGTLTNRAASLGIDNPLGLNDVFTVGANQDLSFGNKSLGSHGFNGSYSVPWGYWTATLSGNTNTYYQQIAGVNQTFVSSGNSQTAALRLARVLNRSKTDMFGVEFQLSKRFGESFIDDTDIPQQRRNNTFIEAGLTDRHYFGTAQFDGTLAYRQGIGGLGATPDPYAVGPTYRYHMAVLDANLSVPFAVAQQTLRYVTTVHGQFTGDTLFYLDDLTIGSRYTVRGFDGETMLAAEKGFYWRNELQWPIGQTGQALYAGIDYGRVFGPNTTYLAGTQLAGGVIGLRGGLPSCFVGFSYDLFVGTPLYKPSGFPASRITVGVQAIAQF
jgi:filamentous hemagglutinin